MCEYCIIGLMKETVENKSETFATSACMLVLFISVEWESIYTKSHLEVYDEKLF